jgi:bacteriocin-like protein
MTLRKIDEMIIEINNDELNVISGGCIAAPAKPDEGGLKGLLKSLASITIASGGPDSGPVTSFPDSGSSD